MSKHHINPPHRTYRVARWLATVTSAVAGLALLAACSDGGGPSASEPLDAPAAEDVTGTAVYLNYPGWIGQNIVENFEKEYSDAKIKQTASGFESTIGLATTIAQNPSAYDLVFASADAAQQLDAGDFLMPVDEESVPRLAEVEPRLREAFPYGVPIDTGYVGIAYRKDLVSEPLTSWADFWKLTPKYSGKVDFSGNDRTAIGTALLYKGYSFDSTDAGELAEARDAILDIKPHIRAFKVTGAEKALLDGTTVMATVSNWESAAAMAKNPNIEFVVPKEGTVGYVEGIVAVNRTDVPEVALAFMDFFMQPEEYADFVNTTSAARTTTSADDLINEELLVPAFDWPDNANAIGFLGADGVKLWTRTWSEIQAG